MKTRASAISRNGWILVLIGCGVALALLAFVFRGTIREKIHEVQQPALPKAEEFKPEPLTPPVAPVVPVPAKKPTSTKPAAEPPVVITAPKKTSVNLAVPFLSQAPKQVWDATHEDACEEASIAMIEAFYEGKKSIGVDAGDTTILSLVAKEMELFGRFESTTAEETAKLVKATYGNETKVVTVSTADDLKFWLDKGYPVLAFADGKALKNPNFKNGGPIYHALVVKGYLADGRFITNDPGTRLGADYIYGSDLLVDAIHDWNGGDVRSGAKRVLVILPKTP